MFASKQAHVRMIPMYHQVTSFRIHLEPTELEFEPAKTASSIQCLSYQNEKKRSILVDSDPFIWEYTEYVYTRCWIY